VNRAAPAADRGIEGGGRRRCSLLSWRGHEPGIPSAALERAASGVLRLDRAGLHADPGGSAGVARMTVIGATSPLVAAPVKGRSPPDWAVQLRRTEGPVYGVNTDAGLSD